MIYKILQTTVKLIQKNYCGYLVNMENRGLAELKWFLPRFREIVEVTLFRESNLMDKKGELLSKDGNSFCIFGDEADSMERVWK